MWNFYTNGSMLPAYQKLSLMNIVDDYIEKIENDFYDPEMLILSSITWISENDQECHVSELGVHQMNARLQECYNHEMYRRKYDY